MSETLKPCPLCGRQAVSMPRQFNIGDGRLRPSREWAVICQVCNLAVRQGCRSVAERIWNTRAVATAEKDGK